MLAPSALTTSRKAGLRVVALLFVIVMFSAVAFAVGRATTHVHQTSPGIAPSSILVPQSGPTADQCLLRRHVC
jgi:hypothetical protein